MGNFEMLRSKRASLVLPETPACSQNVYGQDVPAKNKDNEDPGALASEPAATAPAAQNTTDTPANGATPTPQPELGATVTPHVDEHVKTQEYQEPGPSKSQPAANPSDDVQTQQPDAATASTTNEDAGIGSLQPPEIAESISEPAATSPAAQNTTDPPENGATPTPQPEVGATVTPQVDELSEG